MLSSHLPALQIVLPLAAAPLCVLLPRRLVYPFVLAVGWGSLGLAAMLLVFGAASLRAVEAERPRCALEFGRRRVLVRADACSRRVAGPLSAQNRG